MESDTYRFEFGSQVSLADVEMTLHLAMLSVEGLYGEARVRLETSYEVVEAARVISVSGSGEVGEALVKVYAGLLNREIGESAFRVRRVSAHAGRAGHHA